MIRIAIVLHLLACLAHANTYVMHEKRAAVLDGWKSIRRLESHVVLPMRFGLAQSNLQKLEDELLLVSDPASPHYGQHWTQDDVINYFSPSRETVQTVRDWLLASGISMDRQEVTASNGWIHFDATAAEVERLLKTKYKVWTDAHGNDHIGSCQCTISPCGCNLRF